jgi:uncharacterized membrane protein YdbT with pleckstrin-like domain
MEIIDQFKNDELIWNNKNLLTKIAPDEDIVAVLREDILLMVVWAVQIIFIFLVFLLFRIFLASFELNRLALEVFNLFLYFGGVCTVLAFMMRFHNYYLSMYIITTHRAVDIDQMGLFMREVNSISLDNIENVNYKKSTIWENIFDFGSVILETAGSDKGTALTNGFVFDHVSSPNNISMLISSLKENNIKMMQTQQARIQAEMLQKVINQQPKLDSIQAREILSKLRDN